MTAYSTPRDEASQRLVRKLWQYCNILRDDGLSYPDYVEQLTYLLFIKCRMNNPMDLLLPRRDDVLSQSWIPINFTAVLAGAKRAITSRGHARTNIRGARNKIKDPAILRPLWRPICW